MGFASLRRATVVGLVAVLAMAAPVAAYPNRTVDGGKVWLTLGVWGSWTTFGASYHITYDQEDGMTWWRLSEFEMWGLVQNGKDCPWFQCTAWSSGMTAKFLNSAGQQLASVALSPGICQAAAYPPRDRYFPHCRMGPWQISGKVAKIRFQWSVSTKREDGLWLSWKADKTVPIY